MSIADWNAGIIRPVAVAPTGPYQNGAAPGVWTLDQVAYWTKQGLWPTAGSQDPANIFIENLFSTYLYTGNGASQTITNGIDVSGKGGLVWIKDRTTGFSHRLFDTVRGATNSINTGADTEQIAYATSLTAFTNSGFSLGAFTNTNTSGDNFVSWTFREQPKFFDVVTYTGNGSNASTLIPHNLGSVPGFVLCKATSATGNWAVFHRGNGSTMWTGLSLNSTAAGLSYTPLGSPPTATNIDVTGFFDSTFAYPNVNGVTYVAYLFAHDAGGFGLSGNENIISCGSWEGNGSTQDISLGYEPQYILLKNVTLGYNWVVSDTMRGMSNTASSWVFANTAAAEATNTPSYLIPTATGFKVNTATPTYNASGSTYIYIAIRRGPMAVPTLATTVFNSVARTGTGGTATVEPGFVTDLIIDQRRSAGGDGGVAWDRLRGAEKYLFTRTTAAEGTTSNSLTSFANMNGVTVGADSGQVINVSGAPWINWMFRRAPSFMDVVCYTGTGAARTVAHNLAAVPELIIVKCRSDAAFWTVYSSGTGPSYYSVLNTTAAKAQDTALWNNTSPTASVFSLGNSWVQANQSGATYVAYLFATCAGVSKVGSYTGTGTTQAIDCGFTAGSRFVLIKRTDSTGSWYIWDSARGITAGNDPYLLLNTLDAEVTGTDYINTSPAGFSITSTAPAEINANGGSYIFLAVA